MKYKITKINIIESLKLNGKGHLLVSGHKSDYPQNQLFGCHFMTATFRPASFFEEILLF
jgi:hypothetical protein